MTEYEQWLAAVTFMTDAAFAVEEAGRQVFGDRPRDRAA